MKILVFILASLGLINITNAQGNMVPCTRLGRMIDCISVPLESHENDAQAKSFVPPHDDKARIYITRPYTIEPTTKIMIFMDAKPIGELAPLTYYLLDVTPGKHVLQFRTNHDVQIDLNLGAGKNYFIEQEVRLFLNTRTWKWKRVEKSAGQIGVMKSRRAKTSLQ